MTGLRQSEGSCRVCCASCTCSSRSWESARETTAQFEAGSAEYRSARGQTFIYDIVATERNFDFMCSMLRLADAYLLDNLRQLCELWFTSGSYNTVLSTAPARKFTIRVGKLPQLTHAAVTAAAAAAAAAASLTHSHAHVLLLHVCMLSSCVISTRR